MEVDPREGGWALYLEKVLRSDASDASGEVRAGHGRRTTRALNVPRSVPRRGAVVPNSSEVRKAGSKTIRIINNGGRSMTRSSDTVVNHMNRMSPWLAPLASLAPWLLLVSDCTAQLHRLDSNL